MKKGDRIMLVSMPEDPDPLLPGCQGTVTSVSVFTGWKQVWVDWDNGRKLALCIPPDAARVIPAGEYKGDA